jgi:hypothetical protein
LLSPVAVAAVPKIPTVASPALLAYLEVLRQSAAVSVLLVAPAQLGTVALAVPAVVVAETMGLAVRALERKGSRVDTPEAPQVPAVVVVVPVRLEDFKASMQAAVCLRLLRVQVLAGPVVEAAVFLYQVPAVLLQMAAARVPVGARQVSTVQTTLEVVGAVPPALLQITPAVVPVPEDIAQT